MLKTMGAGLVAALALTVSASALADHKHRDPAEVFAHADKNKDNFLTKDEVGDKRWTRLVNADANKDGKVSKDEFMAFWAKKKAEHHDKKK
jgi:Ca2+-binding EF-hand superfamily protein